jgi:hypothetical protein
MGPGSSGATNDNFRVRVWDLRKVHEGLNDLGLDWEAPPYPPTSTPGPGQPSRPMEITIVEPRS